MVESLLRSPAMALSTIRSSFFISRRSIVTSHQLLNLRDTVTRTPLLLSSISKNQPLQMMMIRRYRGGDSLTSSRNLIRFNTIRTLSQLNDSAGPIDSPLILSMEKKIKEQLNAESVVVNDAYGDGRHVSIDVISSAFEGQSMVNRQRMVYKAIWEELQNIVHAVDKMTTKTPVEADAEK
ncbi:uncharacterized protein LOC124941213 [Impatiens glandulifera]|uniref:uncharacterized protein LOC124941213 n=1 Tax=Impatiens glandulifera TaxID=253017 RepID=UPI001FB156E3|nr:uncharacterized protein LOC124941213 [Impatiens glandulifera]